MCTRLRLTLFIALLMNLGGTLPRARADDVPLIVRYVDDKVTMRAHHVPLLLILQELERQSAASIQGAIAKEKQITMSFDSEPLPRALELLLSRQSFLLSYDEALHLRQILILSSNSTSDPDQVIRPNVASEEIPSAPASEVVSEEFMAVTIDTALRDLTIGVHSGEFVEQVVRDNDPAQLAFALDVFYRDAARQVIESLARGEGPVALQPLAHEALQLTQDSEAIVSAPFPSDGTE